MSCNTSHGPVPSTLFYARLTSFPLALATFAILGLSSAATEVSIGPIVLYVTPRELIGRVSMVMLPAAYLTRMLSTAVAGSLATTLLHGFHAHLLGMTWRSIDTVFTGAGLLILGGGIYATVVLRGVTLAEETPAVKP